MAIPKKLDDKLSQVIADKVQQEVMALGSDLTPEGFKRIIDRERNFALRVASIVIESLSERIKDEKDKSARADSR